MPKPNEGVAATGCEVYRNFAVQEAPHPRVRLRLVSLHPAPPLAMTTIAMVARCHVERTTHKTLSYSLSTLSRSSISSFPDVALGVAQRAVMNSCQCAEQNPGRSCSYIVSSRLRLWRTSSRTPIEQGGAPRMKDRTDMVAATRKPSCMYWKAAKEFCLADC